MLHFGFEGIKAESNEGGEGVIGSEYKNFTSVMKHEVLQYLGKRQGKPKVWVGEGQPYFVFSYPSPWELICRDVGWNYDLSPYILIVHRITMALF